MSYGQAEKPCNNFKHWFGNGTLCGRCTWQRNEHDPKAFPVVEQIVFALIFDSQIVEYKKWDRETCNWLYSETYNKDTIWKHAPFLSAYTSIELVYIFPFD